MKNGKPNRKSIRKRPSRRNGIIDADGHVRETDEQIMEYMSAGYRSRREAMLYFRAPSWLAPLDPRQRLSLSRFSRAGLARMGG